jgi:hypothetical protein
VPKAHFTWYIEKVITHKASATTNMFRFKISSNLC